jgi:hypothetical protein
MANAGGQRLSRKRFLGAVGAGAGAIAVNPARAIGAPDHTQAVRLDRFGRMFRLPPFAEPSAKVEAALRELGKPGRLLDAHDPLAAGPDALVVDASLSANNPNNPTQTAGTTFFGQFLDHDVTFDATSRLGRPTAPEAARTDGQHLGPVGGRIVAEVFIGLLQTDPHSYISARPSWQPELPSQELVVPDDRLPHLRRRRPTVPRPMNPA